MLFLMVFTTHYYPLPAKVDYLGYALPVFFVMSGFLITNVLLSSDDPSLLGKLKTFYLRRILRICPSYYLVVALLIAAGTLTYPIQYLFYWVNMQLFGLSIADNSAGIHGWFMMAWRKESLHLWSLSAEEQFYIIYPLVLYLTPIRLRTLMLFLILIGSIAARFWFMAQYPKSFYGVLLPVCAEYFVWGCIFSWLDAGNRLTWLHPSWILSLSTLAILALIATEHYLGHQGFFQFTTSYYQTPIALAMGFFIWALWAIENDHIVARTLSWKPLVYFGGMSYTLYLVHLFALDIYKAMSVELPFDTTINEAIGAFVISLLMAMAIWHGVEKPLYSLRRYIPYFKTAKQANDPELASRMTKMSGE